jgi:hypothetical protein
MIFVSLSHNPVTMKWICGQLSSGPIQSLLDLFVYGHSLLVVLGWWIEALLQLRCLAPFEQLRLALPSKFACMEFCICQL